MYVLQISLMLMVIFINYFILNLVLSNWASKLENVLLKGHTTIHREADFPYKSKFKLCQLLFLFQQRFQQIKLNFVTQYFTAIALRIKKKYFYILRNQLKFDVIES